MADPQTRATVATDEDVTVGYVLVDEHAQTAEAARAALLNAARVEWDMRFEDEGDIDAPERRWFKWRDEEHLVPCDPADQDRDSEWWSFGLPDWEYVR